jgi:PAS domain S-box-containing protein
MDLRKKTLLNLSIGLTVIIIGIILFSSLIIMTSYEKLESDRVKQDITLVQHNINNDLSSLQAHSMETGAWDDAYAFVLGKNPDFIEKNFGMDVFVRQDLNIIVFTNTRGDILSAQGYNKNTKKMVPVNQSVLYDIAPADSPLRNLTIEGSALGFLNTPEGPIYIASFPILHSDFSGPAVGTVIVGKRIYKNDLDRLTSNIIPFIAINSLDSPLVSPEDRALVSGNGNTSFAIHPENEGLIGAYNVIPDIYGNNTILLSIEEYRGIYQEGKNTIIAFIAIQLLAGLYFGVLIFYLIDKKILLRIQTISTEFKGITDGNDLSSRIKLEGNDELTRLADVSNQMLDRIEYTNKALQGSERKYKDLIHLLPEALCVLYEDRIVFINLPMINLLKVRVAEDIIGKSFPEIFIPEHQKDALNRIAHCGIVGTVLPRWEGRILLPDVSVMDVEMDGTNISYDGKPAILVIFHDITERKKMEEKIGQSLKEKEVLLREIHHRVKNNMQVISSLISMQSRNVPDESIRVLFRDSQNRIQSIALVHEQLYRSDNLYQIEYGGYLKKMFNPLFESYKTDPQKVAMHIEAHDIMISIEKAVPCSLIVNELISNSLKHAFPGDRKGEIHIGFKLDIETGNYVLDYRDNGVGIPPGKDLQKTGSLGMQLIYGLTQQLSGTITLETGEGAHFVIVFPSKEKDKL